MTTPASGHTVPPAVARQAAVANEAINALKNLNAPPATPPVAPPVTSAPAPVPTAPPAPNPTAAEPDIQEQLRRAEARFATLQGKYNAETATMREQLAANTQLVTQLLEQNRTAPPSPPAAPISPEDRMRQLGATETDIKEYGDLLPLVVKLADNMVRPTLEKLNAELSKIQQGQVQTAQGVRQSRVQALEAQLDNAVPTWRAINEAQEFLDWLSIVDTFSGVTRRVALTDAYNRLDAARVVAIFQAYVKEYPAQARAPGAPLVAPETLMAPEIRGGSVAAPEGAGGKRIWSESEISDFYAKVRKKQVSAEQYAAMMAEIARASAEGRIVPTRRMRHSNDAF